MQNQPNSDTSLNPKSIGIADVSDNLVKLIEQLQTMDDSNSLAKTNEVSMSDNNGGRIEF